MHVVHDAWHWYNCQKNVDPSVYCRLAGNCVYAAATSGIAVRMRRTTSGSDLRLPAARRCREINEPWRPDFNSHTLRAELRGTAAEIWERWNTTAIFLLSNDRTLCGRQQRYYRFTRTTLFTVRYSNKTKNNNMYNNKIYRYIAYATSLCSGTPRRITVTWNSIIKSEIGYQWHIAWRHLLYTETDYRRTWSNLVATGLCLIFVIISLLWCFSIFYSSTHRLALCQSFLYERTRWSGVKVQWLTVGGRFTCVTAAISRSVGGLARAFGRCSVNPMLHCRYKGDRYVVSKCTSRLTAFTKAWLHDRLIEA